jgi:hypothetical protein
VAANSGFPCLFLCRNWHPTCHTKCSPWRFTVGLKTVGRVTVPPSLVLITDNLYSGFGSRDFLFSGTQAAAEYFP